MEKELDNIKHALPISYLVYETTKTDPVADVTTTANNICITAFNTTKATAIPFYKHSQRVFNTENENN